MEIVSDCGRVFGCGHRAQQPQAQVQSRCAFLGRAGSCEPNRNLQFATRQGEIYLVGRNRENQIPKRLNFCRSRLQSHGLLQEKNQ